MFLPVVVVVVVVVVSTVGLRVVAVGKDCNDGGGSIIVAVVVVVVCVSLMKLLGKGNTGTCGLSSMSTCMLAPLRVF